VSYEQTNKGDDYSHLATENPAHPRLSWHYSQQPNDGVSLGAHQQMSG
jgi:hypothetical protein